MTLFEKINTFDQVKRTWKAAQEDVDFLCGIQEGNKKLVNTDKVRFIIWSVPAVLTCPFKSVGCEKFCYALKAEKQYKSARNNRKRNLVETEKDNFVSRMIYTLLCYLSRGCFSEKWIICRIHESGDFYNREYFLKWFEIARFFRNRKGLIFNAYTKSWMFLNDDDIIPENFRLLISIDDSMPEVLRDAARGFAKRHGLTLYNATTKDRIPAKLTKKQHICRCKDCGTCFACFSGLFDEIFCEIH